MGLGAATQGQQSVLSLLPSSDQPDSYRSPFLTETGKSYCSSSCVVDRESEQGLQSFPSELVLVAELIMLLDSMGAKKKGLEEVLKWHSKATLRNANFMNVPVTREANMLMIRNLLPRRMVDSCYGAPRSTSTVLFLNPNDDKTDNSNHHL